MNYIDRLTRGLLHHHLLLRSAAQRTRRVGLSAKPLHGSGNCCLVGRKCLTDGGIVVHVLRHHLQHLRKIHQSDKRRIESLLLRRIGECRSGQSLIVLQPIVDIQNLLRIRRGCRDLGEQGIRIERYRRQQLVQLLRSGWRSLCREKGTEVWGNHQRDQ